VLPIGTISFVDGPSELSVFFPFQISHTVSLSKSSDSVPDDLVPESV